MLTLLCTDCDKKVIVEAGNTEEGDECSVITEDDTLEMDNETRAESAEADF